MGSQSDIVIAFSSYGEKQLSGDKGIFTEARSHAFSFYTNHKPMDTDHVS